MHIPAIGDLTLDPRFRWFRSNPIPVPFLGPEPCIFVVEGYPDDPAKEDFQTAIQNFLALDQSVLTKIEPDLFQYYRDSMSDFSPGDPGHLDIPTPKHLWQHVHLGHQPIVHRRPRGNQKIYISLESNCDWEKEHGLQLVFKEGQTICKLGAYDGHSTNSDAYAYPSFENRIYVPRDEILAIFREQKPPP